MPFPSAIANYTPLRGDANTAPKYAANEFLCLCPNTVIFKALVNGAPSGNSYAQVTFDTVTTGAYTDISEGMTVLIGTDSDIRNATFIGRVRSTPTSSILYINETSAAIADNDNIWVIYDFRVWDKLARLNGGTQYKDYDLTFTQLAPVIYGLQSAYAGICSGSPEGFTVAYAASAFAGTSGATISSYAWTVPSGGTVTGGATNTANVTIQWDAGFYWLKLVVTDSGGRTATRWIPVWAVPSDLSSVVTLGFNGASLSANEGNWSATVDAFNGVSTLLDNTLACIFDVEYYNDSETSILSAVKFVGRLRTESAQSRPDDTYSQIQTASYEIEGLGEQLSRIEHLPFTLITKASPTVWDEIKNLTLWRAIVYTLQEHSTVLNLHSLTFDSTADTFLYPALPTQGGNILSVINDLAVSINAAFEAAPTGEFQVVRNANYQTTAQRNALTTVADFNTEDMIDFTLSDEEIDEVGKIDASGGYYNSTSGKIKPLLCLAPGVAQGIGETIGSLTRQVLTADTTKASAQSELNTRAGHHFERLRRKPFELSVTMPPGYNWLVPSLNHWYTWTIASTDNVAGRAFTTADRWQCIAVEITHDNGTGSKEVRATFSLETAGQAGQTVTYPPPASIPPIIPIVPVFPVFPSLPSSPGLELPPSPTDSDLPPYSPPQVIANGNVAVVWSSSQGWITQNLLMTATPDYSEVTPPNVLGTYQTYQWVGVGNRGLYCLSNDGTNSRFHYTADAFANPPTWTDTDLNGLVYTTIRDGSSTGKVYVEGVSLSTGALTAAWVVKGPTLGIEIDRTDTTLTVEAVYDGASQYNCIIWTNNNPALCGRVNADGVIALVGSYTASQVILCGGTFPGDLGGGFSGGCYDYLAFASASPFTLQFTFDVDAGCTSATVAATKVAYSSDYGATFDPAETITPSLSADVGFHAETTGQASLVGGVAQVYISTSDGGTYAAYGDPFPTDAAPNCIWIPRKTFSDGDNSGSTPQYIGASEALTGSNTSIFRVTSSGTVFTDITINDGANYGTIVGVDALAMAFKSGKRIAAVFDFDGTRKLYTTLNSGTSWTSRGAVDAAAAYIRYRRGDVTLSQLFLANGDTDIKISTDHGATLKARQAPTTDTMIGIEPYG